MAYHEGARFMVIYPGFCLRRFLESCITHQLERRMGKKSLKKIMAQVICIHFSFCMF